MKLELEIWSFTPLVYISICHVAAATYFSNRLNSTWLQLNQNVLLARLM